jgi:hypothetical protein
MASAAKDTGDTTKDHQQKRILEVTEDHNSGLLGEKDTGGATEDRQQKTILEV